MASIRSNVDHRLNQHERQVWEVVTTAPLRSLWNIHGIKIRHLAKCTWESVVEDRLFGHAAELGFYFLFALFPTLLCASSILGLAARSASHIYANLLHYLAVVIPTSALGTVLHTFNETTAASSSGKVTFGLLAAIWSASVGVSAVQDTLNAVYKIQERRSYIRARIDAIGLTILLIVIISLCLTCMFGGDFLARWAHHYFRDRVLALTVAVLGRVAGWILATILLSIAFAVTYYWAPNLPRKRWHWMTPGSVLGMMAWLLASIGLRIYLHFFNNYSVTYGSLGAVIILLTWFYITGLMLLVGAEINSEIEAEAAELQLSEKEAASPGETLLPRAS